MPNDFSDDSHCVALFNLEADALTADSVGTNTLKNNNAVSVDAVSYRQGSASAYFDAAGNQSLSRADSDLSPDFPFRLGDISKTGTFCCWIRPAVLGVTQYIWSKYNPDGGKRSIALIIQSSGVVALLQGHASGTSFDDLVGTTALVAGQWYFIGITYDGADDAARILVWDSSALVDDLAKTFADPVWVGDAPFVIGGRGDFDPPKAYGGNIDELVIHRRVLPFAEIDAIRQGTYTGRTALVIGDAQSAGVIDAPTLVQKHNLSVAGLISASSIEAVELITSIALAIDDPICAGTLESIDVIPKHRLGIDDLTSAGILEAAAVSRQHILSIADLLCAAAIDTLNFNLSAGRVTIDASAAGPGIGIAVKQPRITIR